MKLILDTHLDLAWNALGWGRDLTQGVSEINRREEGMSGTARGRATTSLPEMRRGGVAVCLATVLARATPAACFGEEPIRTDVDYPSQPIASAAARGQLAYYHLLEAQGEVALLRTSGDLDAHWLRWQQGDPANLPVGIILAMEGADPIVEPAQAEAWFCDGL
ncbi:MAG: peptidase, partial [Planctomycetota bacterium]